MTDLERFVELYRSFGIECVVNNDGHDGFWIGLHTDKDANHVFTLSNKLTGHRECHTIVDFDREGKFTNQGVWSS